MTLTEECPVCHTLHVPNSIVPGYGPNQEALVALDHITFLMQDWIKEHEGVNNKELADELAKKKREDLMTNTPSQQCGCYIHRFISKSEWKIVYCPLHLACDRMIKFIEVVASCEDEPFLSSEAKDILKDLANGR